MELLHNRQHIARVHRRTFRDENFLDRSPLWRLDLVLHLHRLNHRHASARFYLVSFANQQTHDLAGHRSGDLLGPLIIPGARAAPQRAGIADLSDEARAPHPQTPFVRHPLRLNLVRHVSDAQRDYIGASENGINLQVAAIEAAGPASLGAIEVKPVILAVDGYVVEHEEKPVFSRQLLESQATRTQSFAATGALPVGSSPVSGATRTAARRRAGAFPGCRRAE